MPYNVMLKACAVLGEGLMRNYFLIGLLIDWMRELEPIPQVKSQSSLLCKDTTTDAIKKRLLLEGYPILSASEDSISTGSRQYEVTAATNRSVPSMWSRLITKRIGSMSAVAKKAYVRVLIPQPRPTLRMADLDTLTQRRRTTRFR